MAYLALARKWRPGSFDDLVGQEHVSRTIQNAIASDKVHHAFLFTGTRGVGKTSTARILARTLNCTSTGKRPCGKCVSCNEISSGNSLDVVEIDAASNSGVGNIREIIDHVKFAPIGGKYRVIVIDEVHMLSGSAFNALLKTLEEPPSHVVFILATTEINKVPQTILSRVLRFDFRRIGPTVIAERLAYICQQEKIEIDSEALAIIAEKGDGSMRDALTFLDQVVAFSREKVTAEEVRQALGIPPEHYFADLLVAFQQHNSKTCIDLVAQAHRQGVEFSDFLDGLIHYLRNLLMVSVGEMGWKEIGIAESSFEALKKSLTDFSTGDLLRFSRMTLDLRQEIRYSPFPRVALEIGLLRMANISRVATIRQMIEQHGIEKKNR